MLCLSCILICVVVFNLLFIVGGTSVRDHRTKSYATAIHYDSAQREEYSMSTTDSLRHTADNQHQANHYGKPQLCTSYLNG